MNVVVVVAQRVARQQVAVAAARGAHHGAEGGERASCAASTGAHRSAVLRPLLVLRRVAAQQLAATQRAERDAEVLRVRNVQNRVQGTVHVGEQMHSKRGTGVRI